MANQLGKRYRCEVCETLVLCTKAGETYRDNTSLFDFSANAIEQSVSRSLRHLGTDYLDIVLLHSNGDDLEILDHTDAMETLATIEAAERAASTQTWITR